MDATRASASRNADLEMTSPEARWQAAPHAGSLAWARAKAAKVHRHPPPSLRFRTIEISAHACFSSLQLSRIRLGVKLAKHSNPRCAVPSSARCWSLAARRQSPGGKHTPAPSVAGLWDASAPVSNA